MEALVFAGHGLPKALDVMLTWRLLLLPAGTSS
jgi:hypothetical protein